MTKLKIHLILTPLEGGKNSAKKVSCEGVVVRCEPNSEGEGYNIAIFFSDISAKDAKSITDYVSAYLDQGEAV